MRATSLANGTKAQTDWHAVNWRQANRTVRNLRQRIFRASRAGDRHKVRSLQKLMLRSRSNALLAVRQVTQLNMGKNTPGVDKLVVKTPTARAKLVDQMMTHQPWTARPARRVYIPKASGKLRPLGIPTIADRAMQAIVRTALEPEWEALFEGCSYGFRPGRGCHDAIEKVYSLAKSTTRKTWILDADIKGAFDNIGHEALRKAIEGFPARELIKQWLEAGYVEEGLLHPTESGTPQGGVISPLLANIAFHGLEKALGIRCERNGRGSLRGKRGLVRYADDFVVFCESRNDAEAAREDAAKWLRTRGLELSEEKTRIVHLAEGFNFLGFNIRRYPTPGTTRSGWKLLIKPSRDAVAKFKERMKAEWKALQGTNITNVLTKLNPIIRGWGNYYRTVVSKATFTMLDNWTFSRCVIFARHLHPKKPWKWIKERYFGRLNAGSENRWIFGDTGTKLHLLRLGQIAIRRHILVRGRASPDDPDLIGYWQDKQMSKLSGLPAKWKRLGETQRMTCPQCGGSLLNDEELHIHHRHHRKKGGADDPTNLRLTHLFCHHQIHAGRDLEAVQLARAGCGETRTSGS